MLEHKEEHPTMKPFTEEDVEFYIQNKVEQRHLLVSKTVDEVQKIIQQLTAEISYRDTRFQAISNSGIHNENFRDQPALLAKWSTLLRGKRPFHPSVQVLAPGQFLITVPLRGLTGYRERQVRHWRYYTVHGAKLLSPVRDPEELQQWLEVEQFSKSLQQWHETEVNVEGDLVPAKVLAVFRELMEKSITSCNLSSKVRMLESFSSVVRVAVETSDSQVNVELVPTVEIPTCWPERARWPRCFTRWPSQEKVQCVKSFGFNLLAHSNYHWQLGFSRAERMLIEGLDEDGGCRMKCFRVMRQMKEDVWCTGNKPILTSYHLQTVLFWTCEKYPRTKDWRCFREGFLRMVRKLHKCVSQHFLKHFFIRGTNLLKYANTSDLDLVAGKLTVFLENPVLCLD
nr:protein mab-21-like 3 isoform X1 [Pelodiscus sinensis]XP_025045374.1 protein mab-21-like 3 isoform X1 [Pelodiscus sinensis]XP_025045375.1 protein mab-21-like 3 isoform X1 [Pelodiscus sinensis]XP_025045376.1 protein mab-21-like 3 isoform X1 [Pelodiscus sinensis]|eukprot:XP_025045373.1 protein mab-21-like 3 isoform X1 [Pelodiscus sinensis]